MATTNFTDLSLDPQSLSQLIAFSLYYKLSRSRMRPLRKQTRGAINQLTSSRDSSVSLTLGDLFTLAHNSRVMVREADRLRAQGKQDEELERCRSFIAVDSRKLARLIIFAMIERVGVKFFGLEAHYYSTAAAWLYGQQSFTVDEMAGVTGIPWFENCEALA